jgi:hypothetical protein
MSFRGPQSVFFVLSDFHSLFCHLFLTFHLIFLSLLPLPPLALF